MISKSTEDTQKIARIIVDEILKLNKGPREDSATVIALSGDLGAGKTAFTQAVAKHLGTKEKVVSPTFVIMKKYKIKKPFKYFYHFDAYRFKNEKEILHLGFDEIISNKENLVFIEWPERVIKAIPKNAKFVKIKNNKHGHRIFKFQ